MRNSKFGLRAFGLALMAALSLMAFSAVAAQAEDLSGGGNEGFFLVKGEKALASLGTKFEATQVGAGTLLVPGRVDILCQNGVANGEFENTSDASATATFTNCTTWEPVTVLGASHTVSIPCTVAEPIVAEGLALPKKHEGAAYVLIEQLAGKEFFTNIKFSGAECPLTKENKVTGSVVAQIDGNLTTTPSLLFSHTIQKLFQVGAAGDHLKFGAFEAYIDGTANGALSDEAHKNKGFTWGVC